jgi:acetylornithine deacetylase/succinyl-diaminopimelate desuccinylase family protein
VAHIDLAQEILKKVDSKYVIDLLRKLIRIPSVCQEKQTKEISAFVEDEMRNYGLRVSVLGDKGEDWDRPNIIGSSKGVFGEPKLMLAAHMDVVPSYDGRWIVDPFSATIIDEKVYGRGAADTKGSLAAMMAACKAVVESGVNLLGDFYLVAWYGDEWEFPGAKWYNGLSYLAHNKLIAADMAIFGEPYDLHICPSARGRTWFDFEVVGKSMHSAVGTGVNAILKAMKLTQQIYADLKLGTHHLLGRDTINIGTIEGGTQPNIVPDKCIIKFDVRFGPHLTPDEVVRRVETIVERLRTEDKDFKLNSMNAYEKQQALEFSSDSNLVKAMKKAGETFGRPLNLGGAVSFGDVWQWKDKIGLKEACLFGPGRTDQAHAINEHIEIKDLLDATKAYALSLLYACGYKD